jgi:hypothetical protein
MQCAISLYNNIKKQQKRTLNLNKQH